MQRKRTPKGMPLTERIKFHSVPKGDCWIWQAQVPPDGYGRIHVNGKPTLAHRASYEAFVGPIPDGLHIDHLCFTKRCVNPAHLEPVTQAENNRRSWVAGRITIEKAQAAHVAMKYKRTHCRRGHPWIIGQPTCVVCRNERVRARRAAKKESDV